MKVLHLRLLTAFLFLFVSASTIFAQSEMSITLDKPGKLSKHNKKDQYPTINKLSIHGEINNADFETISKLTNLKDLNISDVTLNSRDYDAKKIPFVIPTKESSSINDLVLPLLPNLVRIAIPDKTPKIKSINFEFLPSLRVLDTELVERADCKNIVQPLDTIIFSDVRPNYVFPKSLSAKVAVLTDKCLNQTFNPEDVQRLKNGEVFLPNNFFKDFSNVDILIVGNQKYLIRWTPEIAKKDLNDIQIICPNAFNEYPDTKLVISNNVSQIYPGAFSNPNIESIDLGNISFLRSGLFKGCSNLQEIKLPSSLTGIGQEVFADTKIQHLTIPASVKEINGKAFASSQLVDVEFLSEYPPEILEYVDGVENWNGSRKNHYVKGFVFDGIIYVPQCRFSAYNIGDYKKASILEKGSKQNFIFTIDKPGRLSQYITDEVAKSVVGLKINGTLYDTDFEAIYKCHNLRDLDLSDCFILESYETAKAKHDESVALLGLLSAVASQADVNEMAKLKAGRGNLSSAAYTSAAADVFNSALKQMQSGKITASDECIFPDKPFGDKKNPYLNRLVFPKMMKTVPWINDARTLHEIVLPPNAEKIANRAFQYAKIKKVTFPPTLKELGEECFIGTQLEEVDLSKTQIKSFISSFKDCSNLRVFRGNSNLTSIQGRIGEKDVEGFFYTREKPDGFYFDTFKTIHIPRGTKAGWPTPSRCKTEIIDDIDL